MSHGVQRDSASAYAPNHDEVLLALAEAKNYNAWLFARARPYLGSAVLDVGAGIGTFTEFAAAYADSVVALEPDPEFVTYLTNRFANRTDVQVINADVAEFDPGIMPQRFDSILCLNVLEHLPDDRVALRRLHGLLRPGGRLLLLVPAHAWLSSPFDRTIGHERRYAHRPLKEALLGCEFALDEIRYVNPVGGLGWLVSMRLMRRRTLPVGQARLFDRLVPAVRPLDRLRLPFGQSIWAVARRR